MKLLSSYTALRYIATKSIYAPLMSLINRRYAL